MPQSDKNRHFTHWDPDRKVYTLMVTFKMRGGAGGVRLVRLGGRVMRLATVVVVVPGVASVLPALAMPP